MEITKEQAAEAFKNDSSREAIIATLKENGYWAMPSTEKDTFLNAERDRVREDVVGNIKGETYGSIDKVFFQAFNIPKKENEKSTEYGVRLATQFKEEAEELRNKVQNLEAQLKDGTADVALKRQVDIQASQLEALQSQLVEANKSIADKDESIFKSKVGYEFIDAIKGLKFKKDIPEPILTTYLDTVRNNLAAKAKKQNDTLSFYEGDKVALNESNQPATMADMVNKYLKDVIDTGHQANGTGRGQAAQKLTTDGTVNTAAIKSQMDLTKALKEAGYVAGTKEFIDLQDKYIGELGLNKSIGIR